MFELEVLKLMMAADSVHCSSLHLDWRWSLETCIEQEDEMTRIHKECTGDDTSLGGKQKPRQEKV